MNTIAEEIIDFGRSKNGFALSMGYVGIQQYVKGKNILRVNSDIFEMGSKTHQAVANPSLNIVIARFDEVDHEPFERRIAVGYKNEQKAKTAFKMCLHTIVEEEEVRVI